MAGRDWEGRGLFIHKKSRAMMEYHQHHRVRDPPRTCAVCESGHVCESRQCVTVEVFVVLWHGMRIAGVKKDAS